MKFNKSLPVTLLLALMLLAGGSVFPSIEAHAEVNASLSLGKTLIGEGDDFSTQVIGIPWDMKTGPYPGTTTVFKQDVKKNTLQVVDGRWKFTSYDEAGNGHQPLVWMLWTGIDGTQDVLRIGDRFPINTDTYDLLSMYFCSDRDEYGIFFWFYTRAPHDPSNPNKTAWSEFFEVEQGCHFYSLDMDKFPTLQGDWAKTSEGYPNGLRFRPQHLTNTNANFELDWIRLTSKDTSNTVPLNWSGVSPGDTLHFYASRTGCGGEDIPIGTQNAGGSSGTFNWGSSLQYWDTGRPYALPESLEPDTYDIYMLVNDTGAPVCAGADLEIRAAPLITVNKPSMLSGPEFSTIEVGDTWGFSNSSDVLDTQDIVNISYSDGLFNGRTAGEGVWLLMNDDEPKINTAKYRYVSARMKVEGTQTLAGGWLARFFWWNVGPGTDPSGTAGQIVSEGWHTYSIDLTEALMLPNNPVDWEGTPNGFRFDPIEPQFAEQYNFSIDYVILTGDEVVNSGVIYEIIVDIDSEHATSVNLQYDTDRNPNNGLFPALLTAPSEPLTIEGGLEIFLPLLFTYGNPPNSEELPPLPGQSYFWDTRDVPPGDYYIVAEVSDGVNTKIWYSEIPVTIK